MKQIMEQAQAQVKAGTRRQTQSCRHYHTDREGIDMIKVGIIGSTGYAGAELVRLLLQHPQAQIVW